MVALVVVTSIAVSTVIHRKANVSRRRARDTLRTASALTPDTDDGALASVTGVVERSDEVLRSPIAEVTCVVFRLQVIARGDHRIVGAVHAVQHSVPFVLDCGDLGRWLVEADGVDLDVPVANLSAWDFPTRNALLRELGLHDADSERSTIGELVVTPGTRVTIAGHVTRGSPRTEYGMQDVIGRLAATALASPVASRGAAPGRRSPPPAGQGER